jgi:hypothetical protein
MFALKLIPKNNNILPLLYKISNGAASLQYFEAHESVFYDALTFLKIILMG